MPKSKFHKTAQSCFQQTMRDHAGLVVKTYFQRMSVRVRMTYGDFHDTLKRDGALSFLRDVGVDDIMRAFLEARAEIAGKGKQRSEQQKTGQRKAGKRRPAELQNALVDYISKHPGCSGGEAVRGTDCVGNNAKLVLLVRSGVLTREKDDKGMWSYRVVNGSSREEQSRIKKTIEEFAGEA